MTSLDHGLRRAAFAALLALLAPALAAQPVAAPSEFKPQVGQAGKDVVWVPTPDEIVDKMLDMAQLAPGERIVDLGSGDGKIPIAAARRGAIAKGIEYNPDMVELSRRNAAKAGVKVELVQGDIFEADFSNADVVTLYLLPALNEKLRPTLLAMKPGTRVTSHSFRMGDWAPDETAALVGREAHFWRVPAQVGGYWSVKVGNNAGPRIRIEQQFQKIQGQGEWGGRAGPLRDATVRGAQIAFTIADANGTLHRFEGTADHYGPMIGTVTPEKGGARRLFVATRR
jgi:SAM-dependent methyltransferase